jgi:hypothetical protein
LKRVRLLSVRTETPDGGVVALGVAQVGGNFRKKPPRSKWSSSEAKLLSRQAVKVRE